MTGYELLEKMSLIDPAYVAAADIMPRRKRLAWIKWVATAACLCLCITTGILVSHNIEDDPGAKCIALHVQIDDKRYFICGAGESMVLEECGLPTELTSEMAGEMVCYIERQVVDYLFLPTEKQTDIVMYEYAPLPSENVYVIYLDGMYYFAILHDAEIGYHSLPKAD